MAAPGAATHRRHQPPAPTDVDGHLERSAPARPSLDPAGPRQLVGCPALRPGAAASATRPVGAVADRDGVHGVIWAAVAQRVAAADPDPAAAPRAGLRHPTGRTAASAAIARLAHQIAADAAGAAEHL